VNLGRFSVSLTVKDLSASRSFYERLGFQVIQDIPAGASPHQYGERWLLMRNGEAVLGLFQGFFETNTLTFNPPDVRAVQSALKSTGVSFHFEAEEATSGPAAAMLFDPDGNPILLDQLPSYPH